LLAFFLLGAAITSAFFSAGYITDIINGPGNTIPTEMIQWNTQAVEANNNASITADLHRLQD
jgi:hypothetical protein